MPKSPTLDLSRDAMFVAGQWISGTAEPIAVENPASEEVIAHVPQASRAEADRALRAARDAYDHGPWRRMTFRARAHVLSAVADELERRADDLNQLYVLDQGGLATAAPYMHAAACAVVRSHDALADSFSDEPEDRRGPFGRALVSREPVGVVVGIVPWNAPLVLAMVKLAPALLAGCPVVLKVSPETPLVSFVLAEIFEKVGLPAGQVSFLPGGRELGQYLISHPATAHVSFTGSTESGRQVLQTAAQNMTRVTLELGGKSAAIVLDDAAPATAARRLIAACLGQSGQVCTTQSRILVPANGSAGYIEAIRKAFASLKIGDPADPTTGIGPLVSRAQRDRTEGFLASARAEGARILTGGGRPIGLDRGYYVEPTLITDISPSMRVFREEVFGPVVCVQTYDTVDQAIEIANSTEYGLANGIYSGDTDRALAIAERLHSGVVSVNASGAILTEPFGGWKLSGIGREGGRAGVEAFQEYKQVQMTPFLVPAQS
jgi:aldehyde dehydrogenase (NAD+)